MLKQRLVLLLVLLCAGPFAARAQDDLAEQEELAIRAAVERVAPSVVKIETVGGLERVGKVLASTGPTTGLVVAEDGYVISSAFNFIQQPSSILVTLPGGGRAAATIVSRDRSRMLVLLKINTDQKLTVPEAAPRSEMTVGQWAIAVGRTYDQPAPNLSVGVLSATNRIWSTAIQTDAKISPANYGGPLIDIRGRVLGVLVPLSPQRQGGEVAGSEWYDSGIGFAVPLETVLERLPAMKRGEDQHPGLLGISLKPGDPYSLAAELAAAQAGSPAYKAGLRSGDTIVEVDGAKIQRQSQLKHALGPRYAGEQVKIVYTRGKEGAERRETTIELAAKLVPYEHPFLGILPRRDSGGVVVRFVYPDGPAAAAGIQPGDRIVAIDDAAVATSEELRTAVANLEPKTKTKLRIERGDTTLTLELTPGRLPTDIVAELSPAAIESFPPPEEKPATGIVEIKIPEETNECIAFVPESYHPQLPHGVVIVLSAPGKIDRDQLVARWKAVCEERQLIVLAPMSAAADKWQATETAFIRKTLDDLVAHYKIDPTRIAAYGYQTGGAVAWLFASQNVDRVRAICALDALPPPRTSMPDTDPINRLAIYLGCAEKSPAAAGLKAVAESLREAKFPVTQKSLGEKPRDLTEDELAELARWIDTLDRI
jgi:S1-C subfamily serine protease/dienelactone hydrolase